MNSKYEGTFRAQLLIAGEKNFETEYRFLPPRKFRLDFCWTMEKFFVEVDGGRYAFAGGRHASDADYEKRNLLTLHGWKGYFFTPTMITSGKALKDTLEMLKILRA